MSFKKILVSAVALTDAKGCVLLAERPKGKSLAGLWEFPGGKVEPGETPEAALVREIHEELTIELRQDDLSPFAFVTHAYDDFHLLMLLYRCHAWAGMPTPTEGQKLQWVHPNAMHALPMPPADLPLVIKLREAP